MPKIVSEQDIGGVATDRPLMNDGDDGQEVHPKDILLKNKECDVSEEIVEEEI